MKTTIELRAGGKSVTMDGERFDAAARHIIGGAGRRRREAGEMDLDLPEPPTVNEVIAGWERVMRTQDAVQRCKDAAKYAKEEHDMAVLDARVLQKRYTRAHPVGED